MTVQEDARPDVKAFSALAVTLAIQAFIALGATGPAVLAPEIARTFGIAPKLVGAFVGLVYAGSMASSLVSGSFIGRYGAIRVSQACVLFCAAGLVAMASLPPSFSAALVLVPVIIGFGYGPITPASSQILARTSRPERMALAFSIKQTGVPGGTALAGLLLPGLALALGWRSALLCVAAVGVAVAGVAQGTRAVLDLDRAGAPAGSLSAILSPLKLVVRDKALRELSVVGMTYAATQNCLMGFLVVYLTETLGFSLVTAGMALTVANVAGIVGRIGWGGMADAHVRPRTLLGVLGLGAGICAFLTASFATAWPVFPVLAICLVFGATASGWNGVQLAELARYAPRGQAGAVTGAAGVIGAFGVVLGPPTFAALSTFTAGYRVGFAVFGTLSMGCGLWLLGTRRSP